jgi:hypothetical protein
MAGEEGFEFLMTLLWPLTRRPAQSACDPMHVYVDGQYFPAEGVHEYAASDLVRDPLQGGEVIEEVAGWTGPELLCPTVSEVFLEDLDDGSQLFGSSPAEASRLEQLIHFFLVRFQHAGPVGESVLQGFINRLGPPGRGLVGEEDIDEVVERVLRVSVSRPAVAVRESLANAAHDLAARVRGFLPDGSGLPHPFSE